MIKRISKRFLSLLLAAVMVLGLLPAVALPAFAANVTGWSDANIGLEYNGDGNWKYVNDTITGEVTTGASTSCGSTTFSQKTSTLTIKNNSGAKATLSFSYTSDAQGGTVTVAGGDSPVSIVLEAGADTEIELKSNANAANTTLITLSDIRLVPEQEFTATFVPAEGGSYTVDGETISAASTKTKSSTESYAVKATPANGYRFFGWYDEAGKCMSMKAEDTLTITRDCTVTAKFVDASLAVFETGGQLFLNLNEANDYAAANGQNRIVLKETGTLPAGNYTVSNGITLLIPFDDVGTCYTTTPEPTGTAWTTPSPFRTLTMESGAFITVDGAISVSAKHCANGNGNNGGPGGGAPTGPYGYILMSDGAGITINSGGALYCWGYISGGGKVQARSGATVYENMQILDFHGGSATSSLVESAKQKTFLFNQYYVQNVEAELSLESGAQEYLFTSLYAGSRSNSASVRFVGDNDAMFTVSEGGTLTKKYNPTTDRMEVTVDGDASINEIQLSLRLGFTSIDANSGEYVLPITNNMTISVMRGTTTLTKDMAFLPGSRIEIAPDAACVVAGGASAYLYDRDEWIGKNYAINKNFFLETYSPTRIYKRTDNDLLDGCVKVAGTLRVDGHIYTTQSGADICGVEGGKVLLNGGIGSKDKAYQISGVSNLVDIPITPAQLHNGDGSYTETAGTAAGDTFVYKDGVWGIPVYTVTFDANGGEGNVDALTVTPPADKANVPDSDLTREGYTFTGWNTAADGSGDAYVAGNELTVTEDMTLYAQWEAKTYTVIWVNEDGTELVKTEVKHGETPEFTGETPAKAGDAQYTYTFAGWEPELTAATQDVTYKAKFEATVNEYTVTWKNDDGSVLATNKVAYGTVPTQPEATKAGDAQFSYTFAGWSPSVAAVTGDVTYTATYTETVNQYMVTWLNDDGTELKSEEVAYGQTPTAPAAPTKAADAQYTYTFAGWDKQVEQVTGVTTYTAVYDQTVNKYTVTWKNWDGTELKNETYEYGATPSYSGETPTKEQDAYFTYTFKDFGETKTVTGDAEYTAVFTQTDRLYTVKWINGEAVETAEAKYDAKLTAPEAPAKEGHTFKGWNTALDGTGTYVTDVTVTGDVTLYAVWEINTYTVKFVDHDGTLIFEQSVEYGKEPLLPAEPTRENDDNYKYSFKGWSPAVTEVTKDVTYTAEYTATALKKYTVSFNANGGEGEMEVQTFTEGKQLTLAACGFTKENYQFIGWNTQADGNGVTYNADGMITALDEDITLYAQWKLEKGWFTDDHGTTYYLNCEIAYKGQWAKIDGKTYYFNAEGYIVKGIVEVAPEGVTETARCVFDADGVFLKDYSGVYHSGSDIYWLDSGIVNEFAGLQRVVTAEGKINYYYFGEDGKAVKGGDYKVEKNNDLPLPAFQYAFGEDGVIVHDEDTSKNGICLGEGQLANTKFYYIDGVKVGIGLFQQDGSYYYARTSNGEIICSRSYYVSATNGLGVGAGWQNFDADGKMQLTGFVVAGDNTYYYDNGVMVKGLYKIDGEYYYFHVDSGNMYKNKNLWVALDEKSSASWHVFGEDGKMVQNGFITGGDGDTYYYKDAVLAKGFTKIGEDYYLFNVGSGRMYRDATMWVGANDYGFAPGMYSFGADGKMIIPDWENGKTEIKTIGGKQYILIGGASAPRGLYEVNGEYYYTKYDGLIVTNATLWIDDLSALGENAKGNWREFGKDGKMVKTGFVTSTGEETFTYYYSDAAMADGFTRIGDDYYIFNANSGKMYLNANMWVGANSYGVEPGMHYFGADGKMVVAQGTGVVEENGKLYLVIDGVKQSNGLNELDGEYYYAQSNGVLATGVVWVSKTNSLIEKEGWREFGENGKLVKTGFVTSGGATYYYQDNHMAKGFTKVGNDYYFFNASSGKMYTSIKLWVGENSYNLEPGMYSFGADGKLEA